MLSALIWWIIVGLVAGWAAGGKIMKGGGYGPLMDTIGLNKSYAFTGESMALTKRKFIPNQVFVGLPWRTVRPKYERIIPALEKKYPLHFTRSSDTKGSGPRRGMARRSSF